MGISIKHDEIEAQIRRLASMRGTSLTEAIGMAVRRELEHDEREQRAGAYLRQVAELQAYLAALPVLDDRTPDEIMGYDENGLPS